MTVTHGKITTIVYKPQEEYGVYYIHFNYTAKYDSQYRLVEFELDSNQFIYPLKPDDIRDLITNKDNTRYEATGVKYVQ